MSHIDDLIRHHCPNGVEFRTLGEIAHYSNDRVTAELLDKETFVGVDNLLADKRGKTSATYQPNTAVLTAYKPGDVLLGNIRPYLKKVWHADRAGGCSGDVLAIRLLDSFEPRMLPSFLFYVLSSNGFFAYDSQHAKGAKMPRGSKAAILKYQVPVPPLEVQREIVRVLDSFESLEAELEAELEARQRQYVHYRAELLTFGDQVTRSLLGEVAKFQRGTAMTEKAAVPGDVLVVANAPAPVYLHNLANRQGKTVVVARSGANAGLISYWEGPIFLTDAFSVHPVAEVLTPRFLYYVLVTRQAAIKSMKRGAGVPHVRVSQLEAFRIPCPPLVEQERIVDILDKFDALVNDLSLGLPAEMSARRKQYEYYRDRLLTFKEAA